MTLRKVTRAVLASLVALVLQGCEDTLSGPLLISESVLVEARGLHSSGVVERPFGQYFLWEAIAYFTGSGDAGDVPGNGENRDFLQGTVDQQGCMSGFGFLSQPSSRDKCAYLLSLPSLSQWLLVEKVEQEGTRSPLFRLIGLITHSSTESAISLLAHSISFENSETRDQDVAEFESLYDFSRDDGLDGWRAGSWAGIERFLQDRANEPLGAYRFGLSSRLELSAVDTRENTCLDAEKCTFR